MCETTRNDAQIAGLDLWIDKLVFHDKITNKTPK